MGFKITKLAEGYKVKYEEYERKFDTIQELGAWCYDMAPNSDIGRCIDYKICTWFGEDMTGKKLSDAAIRGTENMIKFELGMIKEKARWI